MFPKKHNCVCFTVHVPTLIFPTEKCNHKNIHFRTVMSSFFLEKNDAWYPYLCWSTFRLSTEGRERIQHHCNDSLWLIGRCGTSNMVKTERTKWMVSLSLLPGVTKKSAIKLEVSKNGPAAVERSVPAYSTMLASWTDCNTVVVLSSLVKNCRFLYAD